MHVQKSWDGLKNSELKAYLEKQQEGLVDPNSTQSIRCVTQCMYLQIKSIQFFFLHLHNCMIIHVTTKEAYGLVFRIYSSIQFLFFII